MNEHERLAAAQEFLFAASSPDEPADRRAAAKEGLSTLHNVSGGPLRDQVLRAEQCVERVKTMPRKDARAQALDTIRALMVQHDITTRDI